MKSSEGDLKGPDHAKPCRAAEGGCELPKGDDALDALERSSEDNPMAERLEQRRRMDKIVKDHVLDRHVYNRLHSRRTATKVPGYDDQFLMAGGLGAHIADGPLNETASSAILVDRSGTRKRKQSLTRNGGDMPLMASSRGYSPHQHVREPQTDAVVSTPTRRSSRLFHTNGASPIQEGTIIDPVVPASPTLQTKQARRLDAGISRPVRILPPPRPTLAPKRIPKVTPTFPPFVPKQTEQSESPPSKSVTPILAPTIPELLEKAKSGDIELAKRRNSPMHAKISQSTSPAAHPPSSPIVRKETPVTAPQPWKHLLPQQAYFPSASTASISPATTKAKAVQR